MKIDWKTFEEKMDQRLDRIEEKVDSLQPLLDEYKATNIIKKRIAYALKMGSMAIGILLGAYSIKEKINAKEPTHIEKSEP